MKRFAFLVVISVFIAGTFPYHTPPVVNVEETLIHKNLPQASQKPFKKGEKLKFRIGYGFLGGGEAEIEIKDDNNSVHGKNLIHIVGTGKSYRTWDWFFKVRDRYETFIDDEQYCPWLFIRRVDEGGYIINQDYKFFQDKQLVKTQRGESHKVPANVQDMLSAFFYARTFDFSNLEKGEIVTVMSFIDDEVYPLSIKYYGNESVKVKAGMFDCMKFVPIVQEGRIFKEEEDLLVWISNDANKIPVKLEAKILIGSLEMELTGYEGLAN